METAELHEVEPVEVMDHSSNVEYDKVQSDREMSAGEEGDGDDEESIVSLAIDPTPTLAAVPVR